MKKHLGIIGLLAFVLIAALLMGCNGGGSTATFPPFETTTQTSGGTQTTTTTTTQSTTTSNLNQILSLYSTYSSVHYQMVTTVSGQTQEIVMNYWMKGQKYCMEMEQLVTITTWVFMDEQEMYMYQEGASVVYRMPYDTSTVPDAPTSISNYTPTILGEETYDGKLCIVIQYTSGGDSVKAWIWKDTGFPVKMETTSGGVTTTVIWREFQFNNVSDSVFELPAGVPIQEI
jgi:outer membrane lipoprotein-sorting protein